MRVAIVFNHPYEKSFCNAILEAVTKGLEKGNCKVDLIHLDKDGFNPAMSQEDLKAFVEHKAVDPQVIQYDFGEGRSLDIYFPNMVGSNACNDQRIYR